MSVPRAWDRIELPWLALMPGALILLVGVAAPIAVVSGYHADLDDYRRVAGAVIHGLRPYAEVSFEYPPLAIAAFLPAGLASPTDLEPYARFFALQSALLAVICSVLLAWMSFRSPELARPRNVLIGWMLLVLAVVSLAAFRFDLLAVSLALGAISLTMAGRPGAGGLVIGLGALVKVFPAFFVPVLAAWLWWRADRAGAVRLVVAAAAGIGTVMLAMAAWVGPDHALAFVGYQADRLVQIESLAGSVFLVIHALTASPLWVSYGFQSVQLAGPVASTYDPFAEVILVATVSLAWVVAWLRFRSDARAGSGPDAAALIAALLATGLALVLADKVFSAQYVLWVLPLALLLRPTIAALAIVAAALTTVVFPLTYRELAWFEGPAVAVLVARNALLLGLFVWLLVRPSRAAAPDPVPLTAT